MNKTRTQSVTGLVAMLAACPLYAANWTISPSVTVQETYTDNVTLASSQEQDEFITEVNPSVAIRGEGKRLQLKFDYRMQNVMYADDDSRDSTNHQLAANANAELVERFFFMDASGSIRQQLISNTGRASADNLTVTGNRTDVYAYSLSPYLTHRFGGYVDSELRYTFSGTETGQGTSDSESNTYQLSLGSGERFTQLNWSLNYSYSELSRDTATDSEYESADAEIRYALNRKFDIVGQGGIQNNNFNNSINTNDGSYWSLGFDWHPSSKFSLQVLKGDNDQSATLRLNPSERTSFETTYRDSDVGLNVGGSWSANFTHRTRRSTWSATYSENTTTQQDALIDREAFAQRYIDTLQPASVLTGNVNDTAPLFFDTFNNTFAFGESLEFSLTDEVFLRKRFQLTASLKTGKSDLNAGIFSEQREFQVAGDNETITGWNASWGWGFAPRTRSLLSTNWQQTEFRTGLREDTRWDMGLGITRTIRRNVTGRIDFRHLENESDTATNSYEENRASVSLNISF